MLIAAATPPPPQNINWYDVIVGIIILYGLWRGIRTGLTGEFLRCAGWIVLIWASLKWYLPIGAWVQKTTKMDGDLSNLVVFFIIGIVLYTFVLALRWFVTRKHSKFQFGSVLENLGGGILGGARMVALTTFMTVLICLMRSPFWHKQVGQESIYGRFVVSKLPAVAEVVQKKFPETLWIIKDSRPQDRIAE